jgi:hypothetical protein
MYILLLIYEFVFDKLCYINHLRQWQLSCKNLEDKASLYT